MPAAAIFDPKPERFELPTLGFEVRCSIQLSYERSNVFNGLRATEPISGRWTPGKHPAETISGPPRLSELGGEGYWSIFAFFRHGRALAWPDTTSSEVRSSVEIAVDPDPGGRGFGVGAGKGSREQSDQRARKRAGIRQPHEKLPSVGLFARI